MMKIAAVVCNFILCGFTCLVLATDGPPQGAAYVVLTLLVLLVPVFSAVVLLCSSSNAFLRATAMIGNVALLGFSCWAIVSQYPHPEEEGVVAYMGLLLLTPILSVAALFRAGRTPAGQNR